jgi:hypothetical protein
MATKRKAETQPDEKQPKKQRRLGVVWPCSACGTNRIIKMETSLSDGKSFSFCAPCFEEKGSDTCIKEAKGEDDEEEEEPPKWAKELLAKLKETPEWAKQLITEVGELASAVESLGDTVGNIEHTVNDL